MESTAQLVSITQFCRESTAFNRYPLPHAAWIPLHATWIHCPTLHAIHCIHSGCISQRCMQSTAFTLDVFHNAAWNPVHSIIPHVIQCINQDQLGHAAWNPLHSIRIHWAMLHGGHCIKSRYNAPLCIESTAFNHAAWNPLHSIGLHGPHCMESTAFTRDPFHNAALNPLH